MLSLNESKKRQKIILEQTPQRCENLSQDFKSVSGRHLNTFNFNLFVSKEITHLKFLRMARFSDIISSPMVLISIFFYRFVSVKAFTGIIAEFS